MPKKTDLKVVKTGSGLDKVLKAKQDAARIEAEYYQEKVIAPAQAKIDAILSESRLFCGAILNRNDVLNIVSLAMTSKDEFIEIPYRLYVLKK